MESRSTAQIHRRRSSFLFCGMHANQLLHHVLYRLLEPKYSEKFETKYNIKSGIVSTL